MGLFGHAHKSRKVNNCCRNSAARLESDQPKLDFISKYFKIGVPINAAQICGGG